VYYLSLLGPACLILVVNSVVFVMVARVILKPRFTGQVATNKDTITPAQVRGAFTVMILLGVTWVFGSFMINEAKYVFNYIFTTLNSLQGFLIFVFRCLWNPEARMAWVLLIKTGQFKRRKGPIKSAGDTMSGSSKGDSKINGSYADTAKTNLHNSGGGYRNPNVQNNQRNGEQQKRKLSKTLTQQFDDLNRLHNGGENGRAHAQARHQRSSSQKHQRSASLSERRSFTQL
jgi:hypothetical protein